MADVIIRGGLIHDGSGKAPEKADVVIRGDRIALIGRADGLEADTVIEAGGKAVLPGMIDVHTHTDLRMLTHPDRREALCQGVTTEITGACGIGLFPLTRRREEYLPTMRGILGDEPRGFASCAAYLEALPPTGTNVAAQVSHSPLRMEAAGCGNRPLDPEEKRTLEALAREAFEEGAVGLSTGLAYYPAAFGDTEEVAALCRVAARFDAPVAVHQRTAFREPRPGFDPREEVLEFARRSGARLQFSHYRTAPGTAGETDRLLAPIRRGLREGLRLTADFYPYPVGAGYAAVYLPMWAMEGGFSRTMEILRQPACRERLIRDMKRNNPLLENGVVLHAPKHPEYLGLSWREIAARRGVSVPDMLLDLLAEEELDLAYRLETGFDPEKLERLDLDFVTLLREPFYMLGSDTLPGHTLPHPRSFGAFARMLGLAVKYGMDLSLFAQRTAALPARLYALRDRGMIREGAYADLIVFSPENVRSPASFEDPMRPARGMDAVLVNGRAAVLNGTPTGAAAGRPLRRGR